MITLVNDEYDSFVDKDDDRISTSHLRLRKVLGREGVVVLEQLWESQIVEEADAWKVVPVVND